MLTCSHASWQHVVDMKAPTTKTLFAEFVDTAFAGSQVRAAHALSCTRSMVSRLYRGERAVSPSMAERIESVTNGAFRREAFIWPERCVAGIPARRVPTSSLQPEPQERAA